MHIFRRSIVPEDFFGYVLLLLVDISVAHREPDPTQEFLAPVALLQNTGTEFDGELSRLRFHTGIINDLRDMRRHSEEEIKKDVILEHPSRKTVGVAYPPAGIPLVSCQQATDHDPRGCSKDESNLQQALATFCNAGLGTYVEFFVDPSFKENYERWSDDRGWINDAFVTYMGSGDAEANVAAEEDLLVRSVQHFSEKPIIVANFNSRIPASFKASAYPNLILIHGRSTSEVYGSFNYNKITAMLFTKIRNGMVLDADQFVNHGVDTMFPRIATETTEEYPYPIMPVHWMSRDPESSDMASLPHGYSWTFPTQDAPARSMRWGQAHPTWTHYALPWLAQWTSFVLAPEKTNPPHWLRSIPHVEDEDLLNVAMWATTLKKQWCRYDITSPREFSNYLKQLGGEPYGRDSKYYPNGIAIVFFTAHDAKKPDTSYDYLKQLWDDADGHHNRRAIFYNGQWFESASAMKEFDPKLPCIL